MPTDKPMETGKRASESLPCVLFVDPFAADRGHLLEDDLFLSECILPLARRFLAATSPVSAANLRERFSIATWETQPFDAKARFQRLRLFRLVLSLPGAGFDQVVFQSYEEISTLLYMYLHPRKRVHLIVTNNIKPGRLKRHSILGRFFIQSAFKRASSILVHTEHELGIVKELLGSRAANIHIKPFHKFALDRVRLPWQAKSSTILFLGPDRPHKKIEPVLELIKRDKDRRFRYVFCAMEEDMAPETRAFLEAQDNVELLFGYLSNEKYFELFSQAALIALTHDEDFEGALSGAFCDAVASDTPVIARNMAPHTEFFRRFGPMGLLVDFRDPAWCEQVLNLNLDVEYGGFQDNMASFRAWCGIDSIREVFRNVFAESSIR